MATPDERADGADRRAAAADVRAAAADERVIEADNRVIESMAMLRAELVTERRKRRSGNVRLWLAVAVSLVSVVGLLVVDRQADDRERRHDREQAQAQIDADYRVCLRGNEQRAVLRALVNQTGQGTDLTAVAGFGDLDAPMQKFLHNLAALSDSGGSFRERAMPLLTDRNCEAEYPNHS